MTETTTKALEKINTKALARFLSIAGVATFLPFYIHLQWVTGPIVNALLIIALFLVGRKSALVLCIVPSLMALAGGLLPAVLAPVVPFIILGNILFVFIIDRLYLVLKNDLRGYWLALAAAAAVKYFFLALSSNFVIGFLIKKELMVAVARMLSWTQLFTALTGGMLAWIFLKFLRRVS